MNLKYNSLDDYVLPYFKAREIACKCCGEVRISYELAVSLVELRKAWGGPINLLSCCRCKAHNDKIGGHKRSLHLTDNAHYDCATSAVDIRINTYNHTKRRNLLQLLDGLGWSTGLKESSIHADRRSSVSKLPQTRFFYGYIPAWYTGGN